MFCFVDIYVVNFLVSLGPIYLYLVFIFTLWLIDYVHLSHV